MDSTERQIAIKCEVDGQTTTGSALRRDVPKSERIARTLKVSGIGLGATLGAVLIPILHFVLVPLFFVLTGVFAVTTYLEDAEVLKGEITCPNCRKEIVWEKESEDWPKTTRCPGCSYTLQIDRV